MNYLFPWMIEVAVWDNDGGDAGDAGDGAGDTGSAGNGNTGDSASSAGNAGAGGKTFTQAEVDKFVTKRNKGLKSQYEQLEQNYETLLTNQQLSDEQRGQMESDLENVRAQMRTKEQQLAHEKNAAQKKFDSELKKTQEQANYYKSLYETSTVERAILDAAGTNDAYDANQFVGLLRDKTKVVEELDDSGQKTGRLVPRVEWDVENPETKQIERVLKTPADVIASMKDDVQRYGNLFKSNVARGLGSGNAAPSGNGKVDVSKLTPAEYKQLRSTPEGRRAIGLDR